MSAAPGSGKIASSIVLVAAITLAFGWGTNYDFTTSGLIPTACITCVLAIGLLRAAYESLTLELQRLLHVRRRVLLVGDDEHLDSLERVLTSVAAAARVRPRRLVRARARRAAGRRGWSRLRPDEIVLSEGGFDEETVLELVETAHRGGVRVRIAPKTTELLLQRGEYVPGQGVPLFELQPPVLAGTDWALKKAFDLGVSFVVVRARPAAVAR